MPIPVIEPAVRAREVGPAVVRIGPDRTLLDAPWDMIGCAVAHIWADEKGAGGWVRVIWPLDGRSRRPVAPLDLHLGHVLELTVQGGSGVVVHGIVAEVDEKRMVLVPAATAVDATAIARRVVDVWREAELAAAKDAWRQRIERTGRSADLRS